MIDYGKLRRALTHLQAQVNNWHRAEGRPELTAIDREAIAESVIQRFEVSYDSVWKVLKRSLTEEAGLPDVPNSPKPVLKLAGQIGLLPSPVEQWLRYANARVATSHDYSVEKAAACLLLVDEFTKDAVALCVTLSGVPWT